MSSFVMIEGFHFYELSDIAKRKVEAWIDEYPFDYENEVEVEDEEGNVKTELVTEYTYFSDWDEDMQQDHCFMNGYIFDKHGKPIHDLILTQHNIDNKLNNMAGNPATKEN